MKIFAIGDLHLSANSDKPMDIFGENWKGHAARVEEAWHALVGEEDVVLLPGDLSWAMHLEQAMEDICTVAAWPGHKVLLRGNHDYWWNSLSKLRARLPENFSAIQNDAFSLGGLSVGGSRGWVCPGSALFEAQRDEAIYARECIRLELSLQKMDASASRRIAMLHYPPCNERRQPSGFMELMERYGVDTVVYGHLHGKSCASAFEGKHGGVEYMLCSADHLGFAPRLVAEV